MASTAPLAGDDVAPAPSQAWPASIFHAFSRSPNLRSVPTMELVLLTSERCCAPSNLVLAKQHILILIHSHHHHDHLYHCRISPRLWWSSGIWVIEQCQSLIKKSLNDLTFSNSPKSNIEKTCTCDASHPVPYLFLVGPLAPDVNLPCPILPGWTFGNPSISKRMDPVKGCFVFWLEVEAFPRPPL